MSEAALTIRDHNRTLPGKVYVYPVVSRRAKGVSVGVNVSVTNACNWRCAYCQVEGLTRGASPAVDVALLESELDDALRALRDGDFLETRVPAEFRRIADVAFAGNGEPTSCPNFTEAIAAAARALSRCALEGQIPLVVITNGSYLGLPRVRRALRTLADADGEIWAKLDAGDATSHAAINGDLGDIERHLDRVAEASHIVRTRVQTCRVRMAGAVSEEVWTRGWLAALAGLRDRGARIAELQLYTVARPPMQGVAVEAVSAAALEGLAVAARALGFQVSVFGGAE